MTDALEAFLASMAGSNGLLSKHQDAVALFGYFLSEIAGEAITPAAIERCYAAARIRAPRNISDIMGKSRAFVKTKNGWVLQREAAARFKALMPTSVNTTNDARSECKETVMVVYGRDEAARADMFNLLRALHLRPIEWNDAVIRTGKASPYVGEILATVFDMAQAFLVLLTPDEEVRLREGLRETPEDAAVAFQARPNVILEAGMALATAEARTILLEIGSVRGLSDLGGRHVVRFNNTAERRNDLVQRLKIAGCVPNTDGSDWITLGNFDR